MKYLVATDGACKGNPGPGTWAFVVFDKNMGRMLGHKKGNKPLSTNNEMELTAIAEALEWGEKHNNSMKIMTDSAYCMQGIQEWMPNWKKNNWRNSKKEPVKNRELWERIDASTCKYTLEKVKGHSGNRFNEAADMYCNEEYINAFL